MNDDRKRLENLKEKTNGEVKTSRSGQPYLVINMKKCAERLRVMYFTPSRKYKVYIDKGLTKSTSLGKFSTPTEVLDALKEFQ